MSESYEKLREEREQHLAAMEEILEAAKTEERDLTDDEQKAFDAHDEAVKAIDAKFEDRRRRIEALEARNQAVAEARKAEGVTLVEPAIVTQEARTYRPDGPYSFFGDLWRAQQRGDREALERLERHMAETTETRAVGTGIGAGLVPPTFLSDQYVPLARAGRPTANRVVNLPLPDGANSIVVPKITTGTSVAAQVTENTPVSSTDIVDTDITVPVITIAGQQDVSRQLIDRAAVSIDQLIFADLAAALAVAIDVQVVAGPGGAGQATGILNQAGVNAVTYTSASPTLAGLYSKLADAVQRVQSLRFAGPTVVVMHPRRWAWALASADSSNRPLVVPTAGSQAFNAAGAAVNQGYGQVVGNLLGLDVITDASIPTNLGAGTNEDRIIVMRAEDCVLWEQAGGAMQFTFEQTLGNQLSIKLVVAQYLAFTAARYPQAISVISGTGLVTPTF